MSRNLYLSLAKYSFYFALVAFSGLACQQSATKDAVVAESLTPNGPYLVVLGIAQDAGYPQADCKKDCCRPVWAGEASGKMVSCVGLVDPTSDQAWMLDATPDFKDQLQALQEEAPLAGIFLTHAHIGHYTGLMHLGREVMGAKEVPVYAMPKMAQFLTENGPWSQLVSLQNISLQPLKADSSFRLTQDLQIRPLLVPHRDEFSETVGYEIIGPAKKAIFIPDIDKWEKWDRDINTVVEQVDYALLDGSFYQEGEIPGRDMSQIPHPFVAETMARFDQLPVKERAKVHFIHLNHTNPLIWSADTRTEVQEKHYRIAEEGMMLSL
ncbi:MAG: pyrroloquinoline quinone biosynthesis protein PqqB [Saprospiraceae bacterium]|nr:pyrroloquinoline quinone biosynthesis protein PqqB [Saprospiraceae bacterium]